MRLLVILLFCALATSQRINNETYQDNPIVLVQEIILRDFFLGGVVGTTEEPNDPFAAALWDEASGTVFTWTNGPSLAPSLYRMNYRELLVPHTNLDFPFQNVTFVSTSEYSVETGVFLPNRQTLIMAGSRSLYRFTSPMTDLNQVENTFVFVDFVLPFTSYSYNDMMWIPQFRGPSGTPPNLIGVDWNLYAMGESGTTKNVISLEEITVSYVSERYAYLGSRFGVVEIRSVDVSSQTLVSSFTIDNSRIGVISYDTIHDDLFVCAEVGTGVDLLRINMPNPSSWNGAILNSTNPGNDNLNFTATRLLSSGSCEAIAMDPQVGVAYVSVADSSGIGFLAKVNMRTLELVITYIPIQREDSKIVALHMEQVNGRRLLYGISTYSIAVWEYTTACSQDCNYNATDPADNRGICIYGFCNCEPDWWGISCSTASCNPPCGDYEDPFRGECINGQCVCQPRWMGTGCTDPRCPNDCLGNGDCNVGDNYTCECIDIRGGEDCSILKYTSCDAINDENITFRSGSLKDACLDLTPFLGCGYCGGSYDTCVEGNRQGPTVDSCMWWFYDGGWNPAFIVFIVVMMTSWILMFLWNAYSMMVEDLKFADLRTKNTNPHYYGTKGYQKRLWWRDERSHKSWKMFDQMQFLAAYGIINAIFTTKLYNFLTFWEWSLFLIPLGGPFYDDNDHPWRAYNWTPPAPINFPFPPIPPGAWSGGPVNATKRDFELEVENWKRDYQQLNNGAETKAQLIYPTCVIWFIITFFGFLILYGIYYAFQIFIKHKDEDAYKTILGYRFKHIICRVLHAFYFPGIFLAVYSIQVGWGHHEDEVNVEYSQAIIVLSIVLGLFILISLPGFYILLTQQQSHTEWFDPGLRLPFGSFYAPFKKNHLKFPLFVYLRKAAAACALGAMARGYSPDSDGIFWAQMLVTLAFYVLYLIVLVWKRPYIDMIHLIVDAALCLLNLITLLLSLLAIQTDSGTQDALQWIVLVVQIPCMFLIVVAYCWSSMFYAGYTSPKQFFCCEGKPQIEGDDKLIEGGGSGGGSSAPASTNKNIKEEYGSSEDLDTINLPPENDG